MGASGSLDRTAEGAPAVDSDGHEGRCRTLVLKRLVAGLWRIELAVRRVISRPRWEPSAPAPLRQVLRAAVPRRRVNLVFCRCCAPVPRLQASRQRFHLAHCRARNPDLRLPVRAPRSDRLAVATAICRAPGMCRGLSRVLLDQGWPELFDTCGFRTIARNASFHAAAIEATALSDEEKADLRRKLRLDDGPTCPTRIRGSSYWCTNGWTRCKACRSRGEPGVAAGPPGDGLEDRTALVLVALQAIVEVAIGQVVGGGEIGQAGAQAHIARMVGIVGPDLGARQIESEPAQAVDVAIAAVRAAGEPAGAHRRGGDRSARCTPRGSEASSTRRNDRNA